MAGGLARAGAAVVLHGLDPARLEATRKELAAVFGEKKVGAVSFDITDEDAVAAGVAQAEAAYGPLDILVNNAGIQHRCPCWT